MATKKKSFEESIAELEGIVQKLEQGEAPLAESMALFEKGTALVKTCTRMLDEAEQKVLKIRQGPQGEPEAVPFDGED